MSGKTIKVTYYRTIAATFELEIPEGTDEEEIVRAFLPEAPPEKFDVVSDDFAEIEEEEKGKRCIELS